MKNLVFIFIFCFILSGNAQQNSTADTISEPWKLDSTGKRAREKFEREFNNWFYKVYCPQMKVKISCAHCSSFIMKVDFKIDSGGNTFILKADSGKFCGRTLSEKHRNYFITGIKKQKFVNYFKGKVIKYNFNRTLKC